MRENEATANAVARVMGSEPWILSNGQMETLVT